MKCLIRNMGAMLSLVGMFCACSDTAVVDEPSTPSQESENPTITIQLGEGNSETDSRLNYKEDGGLVKMTWLKGDALTVNGQPYNNTYAYTFMLDDKCSGSATGTFTCSQTMNVNSNVWCMYYPSTITQEKEYLTFSYEGQEQSGNGSLEHLGKYHTIRYDYKTNSAVAFNGEIISFSGDGLDESACIKFNLSGFEQAITPTQLELVYMDATGGYADLFYTHNCLSSYYTDATGSSAGSYAPNYERTYHMILGLKNFSATQSITAYMMLSNQAITVQNGGKFRVYVTDKEGTRYYGDVPINKEATLEGGKLHSITCKAWTKAGNIDGFDNLTGGIQVLQEANVGNGTDIIIMGDGFTADQFGDNGAYQEVMKKAYDDLFSIEPYASLKGYFNVYTINAVSEDNHDAQPYIDNKGNQNGATMGSASTIFNTRFKEGDTHIDGNNTMALQYAMQAIRSKGGKGGSPVTDESEVYKRARLSLMMVMVNVKCYAGTCHGVSVNNSSLDYGEGYSVAYTALGNDNTGVQCKWTTIHEAGGHGFGKLADEYGGYVFTTFSTGEWNNLDVHHNEGFFRNVNKHFCQTDLTRWSGLQNYSSYTTASDVYWAELIATDNVYGYDKELSESTKGEGLNFYRGGYTYDELFCRPTENSVMRAQFNANGQFFNAISRWVIWYRVMQLSGSKNYTDFKSSLNDFISFDKVVPKNVQLDSRSILECSEGLKPLAPPVYVKARWINGRLVEE